MRASPAGGIEALNHLTVYRPARELDAHYARIAAYFRAHPPRTSAEAAAIIAQLTGIKRKPTPGRVFLKNRGVNRLKPDAIPAKTDPDVQEAFQKTRSNHGLWRPTQDNGASFS